MKRVTRLLSDPPAQSRWGISLGLVVLLLSGSLLAMQVDPTSGRSQGLRIESSTDGTLKPGDYREITANGADKKRYYRVDVTANGHVLEIYREDDTVRPLDADARRWLDEVARLSVPPPPPPLPEIPSEPEAPPSLPLPPPPPAFSDSSDFRTIAQLVSVDPRLPTSLGQPIEVLYESADGTVRTHGSGDSDGRAELSFQLRGPGGTANAEVHATRAHSLWTIASITVSPAGVE